MEEIRIFENSQFGLIRTAGTSEEPLFCLADVCKAIGITNARNVKIRLDEEDVHLVDTHTNGGRQQITFVTESGLYDTILRSDSAMAKPFRKWVTSEVLPSIRKYGAYATPETIESIIADPDNGIKLLQALKDEREAKMLAQQAAKKNEQRAIAAEKVIEEQQPKVLFANSIQASPESCYVKELADILAQNGIKIGQNRLFDWMKYNGYLCTSGAFKNQPKQKYIEMGLFQVDRKPFQKNGTTFISATTKVTPKGQQYFINKFLNKGMRTLNDMLVLRGEELIK